MDQREKLIELVRDFYYSDNVCTNCKHNLETDYVCNQCITEHEVDYLLANGVVVLPCRCCECEYQQECKNAQYFGLDGFCSIGKRKDGDY